MPDPWETHKPGVTRRYGKHHRVTVNRSPMDGRWLWLVHRCLRGQTKEQAHGRTRTRSDAQIVGWVVLSTLDNIEIARRAR